MQVLLKAIKHQRLAINMWNLVVYHVGWVERHPTRNRIQKMTSRVIKKSEIIEIRVKPNALLLNPTCTY